MQVIGCADDNRIDVFFFVQQFAEIVVGGAAVIYPGALLRPVIRLHDFLGGFASGNAAGDGEGVTQLNWLVGAEPVPSAIDAQEMANRLAEFMGIPLRIVRRAFRAIADGDALHIRLTKKVEHHSETLRANADECNVDAVAGRYVADATKNTARDNGKSQSGGCALPDERAPSNFSWRRTARPELHGPSDKVPLGWSGSALELDGNTVVQTRGGRKPPLLAEGGQFAGTSQNFTLLFLFLS